MAFSFLAILPTAANWIFVIVVMYIAYRMYVRVEKQIIHEEIDIAIAKLNEKIKIQNSMRNLYR